MNILFHSLNQKKNVDTLTFFLGYVINHVIIFLLISNRDTLTDKLQGQKLEKVVLTYGAFT